MAVPDESEREMREHPNPQSALPTPATGRDAHACSPHGCDPTAGVRDGMSDKEPEEDLPPSASQGGLAPCAARRQPAEDRQGTHAQLGGMAPARREGEEGTWHGPPDRSQSIAKSHMAWPVVTAQPRLASGLAEAVGTSSPCTGDGCLNSRGLAREVGSEAATVGLDPASSPLMHTPAKSHTAWPVETARPRPTSGLAEAVGTFPSCTGDGCLNPRGLARGAGGEAAAVGLDLASPPLLHTSPPQAWPADGDGPSPPSSG